MTVKALIPVRTVNLVAPLAHKATDMHTTETAATVQARSGAASHLIAVRDSTGLRVGSLNSAMVLPTPGIATSTTATSTTTTRATRAQLLPSADPYLFHQLVQAYLDCRHTKRTSASAMAFEDHAEHNLYQLHEELSSGSYQPGRSICFVITHHRQRTADKWRQGRAILRMKPASVQCELLAYWQRCDWPGTPIAKVSGAGTASAGLPGYTAGDNTE